MIAAGAVALAALGAVVNLALIQRLQGIDELSWLRTASAISLVGSVFWGLVMTFAGDVAIVLALGSGAAALLSDMRSGE